MQFVYTCPFVLVSMFSFNFNTTHLVVSVDPLLKSVYIILYIFKIRFYF